MKLTKILFSAFAVCVLLYTCNKGDNSTESPVKNPWFKGMINDRYFSVYKNSASGFVGWVSLPDSTYRLISLSERKNEWNILQHGKSYRFDYSQRRGTFHRTIVNRREICFRQR